jgi:hypothetical protein
LIEIGMPGLSTHRPLAKSAGRELVNISDFEIIERVPSSQFEDKRAHEPTVPRLKRNRNPAACDSKSEFRKASDFPRRQGKIARKGFADLSRDTDGVSGGVSRREWSPTIRGTRGVTTEHRSAMTKTLERVSKERAMTSVIVARVATLFIRYTFIGVTSIALGVLAFGVITGLLA